jgi:hypothetical protein
VLSKIGSIAYKLEMTRSSSIHPVFHVSLLKPAPSDKYTVSTTLPDMNDNLQVPEAVLQRCVHHRGNAAVPQVLIKWSGLDSSVAI